MDKKAALKQALELLDSSATALLGSNGSDGYPNIKGMLKIENEGLKTIWFTTNTSSKRVERFRKDKRACVYVLDAAAYKGLMLVGDIEVLRDEASRKRIWRQGFECYYPKGVDDPDYSVLRFRALRGNYYHGLSNIDFIV